MAITLINDPILELEDAKSLLDIQNDTHARLLINTLTMKFRYFTGRIQLSADATTDLIEHLRADTPDKLYLHCAPVLDPDTYDIVVEIWDGHAVLSTYKYSLDEIDYYGDDTESRLEAGGIFPIKSSTYIARVTYRAGWSAIPGDVIEGAILQGRVDLLRMKGEVGVESRSADGESTSYDTRGIIKPVRELWGPYRMIV